MKMEKPKFVISKRKVLENYETIKLLSDELSYSSKTNQVITKILEKETDCLFSVHLVNELKHVKDFSRVIFLAHAWSKEDIAFLTTNNIKRFIVDNEKDLEIFIEFLKSRTDINNIELFLRLKLKENTLKTERYFVYGMTTRTIKKWIKDIRSNQLINSKIKRLGIHFHRKTQNMSEWNMKYEVETSFTDEILRMIDVINIGGGIPANYANTNMNVLKSIFQRIKEFKLYLNSLNIKLMIEPGRPIAASAGRLYTKILRIYDNNIIVNASVYNSDLDALIVPVKLRVLGEYDKEDMKNNQEIKPWIIKGITPCSLDIFRYKTYLKNPKENNTLIFINAGAYVFASDFCDLDKLETEVVEDFSDDI